MTGHAVLLRHVWADPWKTRCEARSTIRLVNYTG